MKKNSLIKHESTQVVLNRAQNLMDITNTILKNSKKEVTIQKGSEVVRSSASFIQIPRGSFMMGSDEHEREQPIHKVTIDYDFAMSKYQVTVKEYMAFANSTGSHYPAWMEEGSCYHIHTGTDDYYKKQNLNDDAPIIGVSWEDAQAYCRWRSQKEGKHYRLPTEAEWEYTCRAGTTTRWSFGDDIDKLKEYAWYGENANGKAHPVGDKKPNPWGLYDMHGNVWEWCEDIWSENYEITPRDGSANKSGESSERRVLRGGSWYFGRDTRSSVRGWNFTGLRSYFFGFRLVLSGTLP